MAEKKQKLLEQVEFYFSDSNLPNDKFLRSKVASHPDGYVELSLISSFKRMKELNGEEQELVDVLKGSELLELDPTNKLVRRKTGLGDQQLIEARTIYAKGFTGDSTIESVRDFFAQFGKVNCVRLRKFPKTKTFKGSVHVEFDCPEKAQEVVKKELESSGTKLILMMKADHDKQRMQERQERSQKEKEQKELKKMDQLKQNLSYETGCVAKVEGAGDVGTINERPIKDSFGKHGDTKWVEKFENTILVRFASPEEAQKAIKGFTESKEKINDKEVTIQLLSGDEEVNFYVRAEQAKFARVNQSRGKKGVKRGQKRKNGGEAQKPKAKAQKTE